jgi:hypothetical protein
MSQIMNGTVTIVQEGRFQMTDDAGVSHLFILSPHASAETRQLTALQQNQSPVQIRYDQAPNLIGNVASAIYTID